MRIKTERPSPVYLNEGERLDDLIWGGLKIIQQSKAPCFAIDALLLTGFVRDLHPEKAADLGTGTGVIPLLLSVVNPETEFYAVELMPLMTDLAERSVRLNGLEKRIHILSGDNKNCSSLLGKNSFDLITANPPYQKTGAGRLSEDPLKAAYQSEIHCTLEDIVREAAQLLKKGGSLALIHKAERLTESLRLFEDHRLGLKRLCFVHSFPDTEAMFFLIEGEKGYKGKSCIMPPLVIYEGPKQYTEELKQLFRQG